MTKNNCFTSISESIRKGGELSPFLFLGNNLELLHRNIESFVGQIFQEYKIDRQSLFHLSDVGESLKIEEVKKFVALGDIKARFAFQIFFIENISRMTTQAQNACLKFFEEPGEGNIVILTNQSEAGILETILSRVQIQYLSSGNSLIQFSPNGRNEATDSFYYSMIVSHVSGNSDELVRYFFTGKYEKTEYIEFLKVLISYISQTGKYIEMLDELHEDIGGILKNNLQGKYVADKYILKLKD